MSGENSQLTERIIGCAYTVANTLGHGFLEKVYEQALMQEMAAAGLRVEQQKALQVLYKEWLSVNIRPISLSRTRSS